MSIRWSVKTPFDSDISAVSSDNRLPTMGTGRVTPDDDDGEMDGLVAAYDQAKIDAAYQSGYDAGKVSGYENGKRVGYADGWVAARVVIGGAILQFRDRAKMPAKGWLTRVWSFIQDIEPPKSR